MQEHKLSKSLIGGYKKKEVDAYLDDILQALDVAHHDASSKAEMLRTLTQEKEGLEHTLKDLNEQFTSLTTQHQALTSAHNALQEAHTKAEIAYRALWERCKGLETAHQQKDEIITTLQQEIAERDQADEIHADNIAAAQAQYATVSSHAVTATNASTATSTERPIHPIPTKPHKETSKTGLFRIPPQLSVGGFLERFQLKGRSKKSIGVHVHEA